MKWNKPTCESCRALLKAINAFIEKEDNDLEDEMKRAGYVDAKDSIKEAEGLEEELTEILEEQTAELAEVVEEAGTIPKAKKAVKEYFKDDVTGEILEETFSDYFSDTIMSLADSYMKETEGDLAVTQLRQRTHAWINEWSEKLSNMMQLTSEQKMGSLLEEALNSGKGTAVFAQKLLNEGIRQEGYRARAAAVTEMLRAHSVAQQESIIQSPATDRKKWVHSGSHKNKPRENHVKMNGQIVPKADPFELIGRDGNTYHPMYPRDPVLPAAESINCHCIHIPVSNDDILGLSYEERQQMQQEIIAADDGEWEKQYMAKPDNNKGMKRIAPIKNTKEEIQELMEYADSLGVKVVRPDKLHGNISMAKEQIEMISKYSKEYKIDPPAVRFEAMDLGDLGKISKEGSSIIINNNALRNRKETNDFLNADNALAATESKGISVHEIGHALCMKYGDVGIEIARKTYYNLYKKEVTSEEFIGWLNDNISEYSSVDGELIPELLSKDETNPTDFTAEFTKLLKERWGI